MSSYITISTELRAKLLAANEQSPDRKLIPVELSDGTWVLNADILDDCGPGQTWDGFASEFGSKMERAAIAKAPLAQERFKASVEDAMAAVESEMLDK